ncbi:MAG: peptidylprolyl isomerase [Maricaulaceae bacterium]
MSRTGFRAWIKRFILLLSLMLAACSNTDKDPSMEITFVTDLGNIVILLDENIAPNTSAFFLKQLESGTFESTSIYRAGCPFYPVCCDDPLK